jgi:uncharacterized protein YciI
MARFALICTDKPGALELRLANREAHLAYIRENQAMIVVAGPMLDEAGGMRGSLLILEAPDASAVEAFSAADPYRQAGLFERVEISAWRQTVGTPV